MSALIEVNDLHKHFGNFHAIRGISLNVQKGEVLGFLGPNGAGKTTTMRMITGYLQADKGSIRVAGLEIGRQTVEAQKHIGYLPEGSPLYPDMTPDQLLRFVGHIRQLPANMLASRYDKVVAHLSLEEVLYQPIETLSKGFKRRVGLAQAILHDPDILILDEPTDGLDPLQKREVRKLIKAMAKEKAIVISTHILEEVDAVCTRAIIISHGQVMADATPPELKTQYSQQSLDDIFCSLATGEKSA